jgi:hypothetical protein
MGRKFNKGDKKMGININITAGKDKESSSVGASGSLQHLITDAEVLTFKVGDSDLKNDIDKYFGKKPKDAYLKSPTPWGDLYKKYGWEQVGTLLRVKSATITEITSEPVIIAQKDFVNDSSHDASFNAKITDTVTDTSTNTWMQTNSIQVGQKITYGITIQGVANVGGETSFSYTGTWGEAGSHSKSVVVGTETGVSVSLGPHQSAKAELTASRGTMKVRIVYEASLIGRAAVNYNPKYKGHHFYGLPIASVLSRGGANNSVEVTEDVEIGFYSNSQVIVTDGSGKVIERISAENLPGEISDNEYEVLTQARAA